MYGGSTSRVFLALYDACDCLVRAYFNALRSKRLRHTTAFRKIKLKHGETRQPKDNRISQDKHKGQWIEYRSTRRGIGNGMTL